MKVGDRVKVIKDGCSFTHIMGTITDTRGGNYGLYVTFDRHVSSVRGTWFNAEELGLIDTADRPCGLL